MSCFSNSTRAHLAFLVFSKNFDKESQANWQVPCKNQPGAGSIDSTCEIMFSTVHILPFALAKQGIRMHLFVIRAQIVLTNHLE